MEYRKGDRVRHPKRLEWGVGQILADGSGDSAKIFFERGGERAFSLDFVQPVRLVGDDAGSAIHDSLHFSDAGSKNSKVRSRLEELRSSDPVRRYGEPSTFQPGLV